MPVASPPPLAERVFGDRLALATEFARMLIGPGTERGLIGPREAERVWDRHLLNSAAPASLIPAQAHVIDLGSGAGLPGLVLAIARPDTQVTLVEPMLRRVGFLDEVVAELGLDRVRVVRGRAEELWGTLCGDVVTARAVASLDRLVALSGPLLLDNGELLALKGASAPSEVAAGRRVLQEWGARAEVVETGDDVSWPRATVVRVRFPADHTRRHARDTGPRGTK